MGAQQGNRGFRRSHKTIQLCAVHLIPLGLSLYLAKSQTKRITSGVFERLEA